MSNVDCPKWAVAAVALFGRDAAPLIIRVFTSPPSVLSHPDAPACANLYVGPNDVVSLHFLIFTSLDSCADIVQEWHEQRGLSKGPRGESPESAAGGGAGGGRVPRLSAGADIRFLGLLMRTHRFTSYGFQSASGIRTILAIVGDAPLDAVLPLCRSTYEAASAALCNPFRTPRMHAQLLQRWFSGAPSDISLPAEYRDNLRAAPTPETVGEEPSLAYSRGFREQVNKILAPFSATARSSIV